MSVETSDNISVFTQEDLDFIVKELDFIMNDPGYKYISHDMLLDNTSTDQIADCSYQEVNNNNGSDLCRHEPQLVEKKSKTGKGKCLFIH